MVRIADLVNEFGRNDRTDANGRQFSCPLPVSADTPVREALRLMQELGCDCVSVGGDAQDSEAAVLSREELVKGLLKELDLAQQALNELHDHVEGGIADQLELVERSVQTLAVTPSDRLAAAVETLADGLIVIDRDGSVEWSNAAAKRMLGLELGCSPDQISETMDAIGLREAVLGDGADPDNAGEMNIRGAAGRILRIRWNATADAWDQPLGTAVSIQDVTDLSAAEAAKSEFLAMISHELRTPLTGICNAVSNMHAGVTGPMTPKARQYLHAMDDDCRRLAALVNDLLDMAKLQAGAMPIRRRVMHVVNVARQAAADETPAAREKDITLTLQVGEHIPPAYADEERVGQVLRHLLENAVRFTNRGGRVTVRVRDARTHVVTEVADTGVGIAAERQGKLFNKFYQIERQAGAGSQGSGLGLALSHGIVAAHGGAMWVESEPGQGSTFFFSLPKTDPHLVLSKYLAARRRMNEGAGVIVVRLDVPYNRQDSLRSAGHSAVTAILAACDDLPLTSQDLSLQTDDFEAVIAVRTGARDRLDALAGQIRAITAGVLKNRFGDGLIMPMLGTAVWPGEADCPADLPAAARRRMSRIS